MEKVTAGWQRGGAQNETRQAASLQESYVDCKRRAADSGAARSWGPGVDERRSHRAGADLCRRLPAVQRGGAGRHETGCAEQFSDWGDSLSVDRFDRAEDSHFRRHGGRARLRVGRGRGRWKEIQRALRLPRCATETQWGVEIGGVAVGAAGRRVTATFCFPLCTSVYPVVQKKVFTTGYTEVHRGKRAPIYFSDGRSRFCQCDQRNHAIPASRKAPTTASNLWKYLPSERQFSPSFMPK